MEHKSPASATWIVFALLVGQPPIVAQTIQPLTYEETGVFDTGRLRESSGVAVSRRQPGVIWTHNDSGDRAILYATNLHGSDLGSFGVSGATGQDWEDISLGPCPNGYEQDTCIYIADTGDNEARREYCDIYIVPEPDISTAASSSPNRTERAQRLRVTYASGPRDVEALAVTPNRDILLITKGTRNPIELYSIPAGNLDRDSVRLTIVDTLPIVPSLQGRLVTAAAVSPSGQSLAVRTYTELYFFKLTSEGDWDLRSSPCWLGLRQPQGEAVDFLDETTLVLTSESAFGRNGGLARVVCPPPKSP